MDRIEFIGFIHEFTDEHVIAVIVIDNNEQEMREFSKYPLFANMELFEGKNFKLEIETGSGTQTCKCVESSESKFQQIINAWTTITDI